MKQLTIKLIIPLTILSFVTITKWWLVTIVDAPNETLTGFPLPFVCRAWHTSGALQFFVGAFIIDFFFYFLCCFGLIFLLNKCLIAIKPTKVVSILLWFLTVTVIIGIVVIVSIGDHVFYLTRPFDFETLSSGIRFIWDKL